MAVLLRIVSTDAGRLGNHYTHVFGRSGGTIGRGRDADWILPDEQRYISSLHAKIEWRHEQWVLIDTSANGVYVNGSPTPVPRLLPTALNDLDRMRIGDYEIVVRITPEASFSGVAAPADAQGPTA